MCHASATATARQCVCECSGRQGAGGPARGGDQLDDAARGPVDPDGRERLGDQADGAGA